MRSRCCILVLFCGALLSAVVRGQEQTPSKEDIEQVKEALKEVSASVAKTRTMLDDLRKIKLSGFIQTQFRYTDEPNQDRLVGFYSGGLFPPKANSMFQVRRARFKLTYQTQLTSYVFHIEGNELGLRVKDVYVSLIEPWTGSIGLQAGMFYRPYGYEVPLTSSIRESPERARVFQALMAGERDIGAKIFYAPKTGPLTFLRADLAVFNGSGPSSREFDKFKDVVARLAAQVPYGEAGSSLDLGVSGYFGTVRSERSTVYSTGTLPSGVPGYIAVVDPSNIGAGFARRYLGADAQWYTSIAGLGALSLKGEVIGGTQPADSLTNISFQTLLPTTMVRRDCFGWYLALVQHVGEHEQLIVKFDVYDPNTDVSGGDFSSQGNLTPADLRYSTLGVGWLHHWDDNIKFTVYYEFVWNEKVDAGKLASGSSLFPYTENIKDDVLTMRIQFKF